MPQPPHKGTAFGRQAPNTTREAVLDAAVELFAEQGAGVRVEDIAQKAGVSRQSVYVHFGSRTGLLVALVQHVDSGGTLDHFVQQVLNAPSSLGALDAVVRLHAEYSPTAYPVARVFLSGRREDEALAAAWADRMEGRRRLYMFVVEWLQRDGLLAAELNATTATDMLEALTSWHVWEQLVIDKHRSKEQYFASLRTSLRRLLVDDHQQENSGE